MTGISTYRESKIEDLKPEFTYKNWQYKLIRKCDKAYFYMKCFEDAVAYEVFLRKIINKFDFQNKTELPEQKVAFPKDNAFGVWAWCFQNRRKAYEKFKQLKNGKEN